MPGPRGFLAFKRATTRPKAEVRSLIAAGDAGPLDAWAHVACALWIDEVGARRGTPRRDRGSSISSDLAVRRRLPLDTRRGLAVATGRARPGRLCGE